MLFKIIILIFSYVNLATGNQNKLNEFLFSGDYEMFDLTHSFDTQTIYWPGVQVFEFTKQVAENKNGSWYASNDFRAGEHGGTHIDAPYHFKQTGKYVGDLPLENLIVPLIIIDISSIVNGDPNFVLQKHHLDYMINDNLGKPCLIIFKFGWSKYFQDRNKYLGIDQQGELNFPGLSSEVMEWVVKSYKNVVGIGVDVASVDPGSSKDFPVHKITATHGLYNIENANLHQPIPEYGCTALALPMKISFGTGAPLRLVAVCPRQLPKTF